MLAFYPFRYSTVACMFSSHRTPDGEKFTCNIQFSLGILQVNLSPFLIHSLNVCFCTSKSTASFLYRKQHFPMASFPSSSSSSSSLTGSYMKVQNINNLRTLFFGFDPETLERGVKTSKNAKKVS